MDLYQIEGGIPLNGEVQIQGSKNAVLPMMAASVLQKGCVCLKGCPDIADVQCMEQILQSIGVRVWRKAGDLYVDCKEIDTGVIPGAYADKMRSSIILMGALLGRVGRIRVGRPGGCTIGERPINLHLSVLEALGVALEVEDGVIYARADRIKGGYYKFPKRSVGATENGILAAVAADGVTVLENCAREPEIIHLCQFLRAMGAKIVGEGSAAIHIEGVKNLHETSFPVPADRIVAGTYLLACAVTRGNIRLTHAPLGEMQALLGVYKEMGGQYEVKGGKLIADSRHLNRPIPYLKTEEYPGFPTDLQSLLLTLCATVPGESRIEETIFEDRFKAALQIKHMGADVRVEGRVAVINGQNLHGATVKAEELRGGAALVLAGLGARGITRIGGICHIERGYQDICGDIRSLGGNISRQSTEEL